MTYTFKLSRRLALSRVHGGLVAAIGLAACVGDSTAPESLVSSTNSWSTALSPQPASSGHPVAFARHIRVAQLILSPDSATLAPGVTQQFVAYGRTRTGDSVSLRVTYSASGGTITQSGQYTAGSSGGTYRIIASSGPRADTSVVTLAAAPSPTPLPPASPTLVRLLLRPESVTLLPGATQQFLVYGRMSNGDSVAVSAAFAATGGSLTSAGLYTAAATSGSYRIVATSSGLADTSSVSVGPAPAPSPAPAPAPAGGGIPFGQFHVPDALFGKPYTGALRTVSPTSVLSVLKNARAARARIVLDLAGSRRMYTNADGTWNLELWKQRIDRYRGMDFAPYVADGTVIVNYLLDEPNCPECWGGKTIPFADIEAAAKYSKSIWPYMPTGVRVIPSWLQGAGFRWVAVDMAWAQYKTSKGDLRTFLNREVTAAKALSLGLVAGMNITHGGSPDRTEMTPAMLRSYGELLAREPYSCGFINWQYETAYESRADIQDAMDYLVGITRSRPSAPCVRH